MVSLHRERFHATDDGADEINIKDGVDVHEVEDDGHGEEAKAAEACHHEE